MWCRNPFFLNSGRPKAFDKDAATVSQILVILIAIISHPMFVEEYNGESDLEILAFFQRKPQN